MCVESVSRGKVARSTSGDLHALPGEQRRQRGAGGAPGADNHHIKAVVGHSVCSRTRIRAATVVLAQLAKRTSGGT